MGASYEAKKREEHSKNVEEFSIVPHKACKKKKQEVLPIKEDVLLFIKVAFC